MAISSRSFTTGLACRLREGLFLSLATARAVSRSLINRRAARRLADLPDYLLKDVGLKRDDIHDALAQDWRCDPTYLLAVRSTRETRCS